MELKLQQTEELWRVRVRDGNELFVSNGGSRSASRAGSKDAAGGISGMQMLGNGGGGSGGRRGSFDGLSLRAKFSQSTTLEDVLLRLQEKSARVSELEVELEKMEREYLQQGETTQRRLKNSELQIKLLQANLGDDAAARLRGDLLREHDEELKKVSEAAKDSVSLLQEVVEQKEKQLRSRDAQVEEMQIRLKEDRGFHQQEVNELKSQLVVFEKRLNDAVREATGQIPGGGGSYNFSTSHNLGASGVPPSPESSTALRVLRERGKLSDQERSEQERLIQHQDADIQDLKLKLREVEDRLLEKAEEVKDLETRTKKAEKNYEASNLARILQICRKQLKEKQVEIVRLKETVDRWKAEQVELESKKMMASML